MSNITIRIDDEIKKQAGELFSDLGLTMNQAINLFLRTAIRQQGIPFELKRTVPNKVTLQAIEELKEMERHPEEYESYHSVEELMKDLNGD